MLRRCSPSCSSRFIIQIVFRYLLNFPIGWTSELSSITWIWLVLWGAAFVVREDEEIRFDILYGSVRRRYAGGMVIVVAVALVVLSTPSRCRRSSTTSPS